MRRDPAMRGFPFLDVLDSQEIIGVLGGLCRDIDHGSLRDEVVRVDSVERVIGQVASGNPMDGSIEMRARMLADGEVVPVTGYPALIVPGNFIHGEASALNEFRRQEERGGTTGKDMFTT